MAKRKFPPSISLLLPFPDEVAERGGNPREGSTFYMHCELDKSEIQNVHNAYMSTQALAIGTQDALALRDRARIRVLSQPAARTPLPTLADLLFVRKTSN